MPASEEFWNTYACVFAVCAIKLVVIQVLQVRCHLAGNNLRQKEDAGFFLAPVFQMLLVATGPATSMEFEARLSNNVRNCVESELWCALIAGVCGFVCTPPAVAVLLLKVWLAFRFAHFVFHIVIPLQPFRAICWIGGTVVLVFFAYTILEQKKATLIAFKDTKFEL